jgi:hypothetical protein
LVCQHADGTLKAARLLALRGFLLGGLLQLRALLLQQRACARQLLLALLAAGSQLLHLLLQAATAALALGQLCLDGINLVLSLPSRALNRALKEQLLRLHLRLRRQQALRQVVALLPAVRQLAPEARQLLLRVSEQLLQLPQR